MARRRVTPTELGQKPNPLERLFGTKAAKDYAQRTAQNARDIDNNNLVDRRAEVADALGIPQAMRNEFTRGVGDRYVDAERYLQSPEFATTALITGGTLGAGAVGLSALKAYGDQQADYLPTGPLAVAGRMVNNVMPSPVGVDPLAEARNNVASARQLVGSENVLAALAEDEIGQLRGEQQAAMTPMELEQLGTIQQMIDQRTGVLMQQPIQRADGSVTPMPFDTAQRLATEQVHMEMRASQVY